MKIDTDKTSKLIVYLCTLKGWAIRNYDRFIVTWEDDDGFTNWCDNDIINGSWPFRLERLTKNSKQILSILGWDENTVHILHRDAKYMEEKYSVKALE